MFIATVLGLALLLLAAPGVTTRADAADTVVTNYSFESDLSGWTQFGVGGNLVSTEQAYDGTKSAKIVDGSATDGTGLDSARLAASAGSRYAAFAHVYVISGVPDLYLRFHSSSGALVGTFYTRFVGTTGTWTTLKVTGTAPTGTARVSAMAYSSKGNVGTAYFDQVAVTPAVTNLGVQVDNSQVNGATFGIGAHQDKIFGVFTGSNDYTAYPARFAAIDADTASAVGSSYPLAGAVGAWGATTATDGNVYVGTYSNGHVYRHTPGATGVTDLGQAIAEPGYSEGHIWGLTAGTDGRIYGGTYDQAGYFKYEPGSGFSRIGSMPIWPGKSYVRSLTYDAARQLTFLGVGTDAALVTFDRVTGAKYNILPSQYAAESMVGGLTYTGGRLFAVMSSSKLSVLKVNEDLTGKVTATEEATLSSSALMVSPARDGKVYVLSRGALHVYDIAAQQFTSLGVSTTLTAKQIGWVNLADQTNYPGATLVAIGAYDGRTQLFKYNPSNGRSSTVFVTGTPVQPTNLNAVGAGPDGKIYTGGYLTGHTGVYEPFRGDSDDRMPETVYRGLHQTDSILSHNGKVYFGTYSGANMYEYDPTKPWQFGSNPRHLAALSTQGQDRPYAQAAGDGKLFVGTVPYYGQYDGALSIIDLAAGGYTVIRDIVANQSVIAVAYHNGLVWGGTTIRPGLGVEDNPLATEAKLFSYNPATGAKVEYSLPASRKLTALTALAVVDGRIWGLAEGFLFRFDPATRTFATAPTEKFPEVSYAKGSWRDGTLLTIPQDSSHVYGTIGNSLFKINKSTLVVTKLVTSGADGLTADTYGNLYYRVNEKLYRYVP